MRIRQPLFSKVKGVTSTPPKEPETNNPPLKQPIQYSLEMILKTLPLSEECSALTEGLLALSVKEHLEPEDVTAFQERIAQEIKAITAHLSAKSLPLETYHHLTAEVIKLEQLKDKIADAQTLHYYDAKPETEQKQQSLA